MTDVLSVVQAAVEKLEGAGATAPRVALILGSGLGHIADRMEGTTRVTASDIPGYPPSTVEGHDGVFVVGTLDGKSVVALSGRIHGYEGHAPEVLGIPARILCALEPEVLIVTNAAGGIRDDLVPGDLMLIADHVNLTALSPLMGANIDAWGPRFPDMSDVYPTSWRDRMRAAASASGVPLQEGVYGCVSGPQYETPAEIRAMRAMGIDAVGMSTVPEAIVASHMGIPVLGVSVISNKAAGMSGEKLAHEEVLEASATAGRRLGSLLLAVLGSLG
ncbi:MAG: purine-nucleoside phosphorylase [Planctomycetes bacterium]|nr:purine-nucleoside phosphorylase [Planctomycetota bacterium]